MDSFDCFDSDDDTAFAFCDDEIIKGGDKSGGKNTNKIFPYKSYALASGGAVVVGAVSKTPEFAATLSAGVGFLASLINKEKTLPSIAMHMATSTAIGLVTYEVSHYGKKIAHKVEITTATRQL